MALVLLAALLGPWIAPYDPAEQLLEHRLERPSWRHPLGLDELGRDILSRLLHGARVSVSVGLAVVVLAGLGGPPPRPRDITRPPLVPVRRGGWTLPGPAATADQLAGLSRFSLILAALPRSLRR